MARSTQIPMDATGVFDLDKISTQKIERKLDRVHPGLVEIGQRFRKARKDLGLDRAELAKKLNCTERHLMEIELGAIDIDFGFLLQLAEALDRPLTDLLIGTAPSAKQSQTLQLAQVWARSNQISVAELLDTLYR